jgi:ribonucleoside-diphosphate reductase alpha chain
MRKGLPYDSDEARYMAAAITSLIGGTAYRTSAEMAQSKGSFSEFEKNRIPFLNVIKMHRDAVLNLLNTKWSQIIASRSLKIWEEAITAGYSYGFRNAQVTCIAPTGTIGLLMDSETTGIEPFFALTSIKKTGQNTFITLNNSIRSALENLGYGKDEILLMMQHLATTGTLKAAPGFNTVHEKIFECAVSREEGISSLSVKGHLQMMAAVQPFISVAISKTVNLPANATKTEIDKCYREAFSLGLKSVAVYRDGCKISQPLSIQINPEEQTNIETGCSSVSGCG